MICNIRTQSDADFVRAIVLRQPVAAWSVSTFYAAGAQAKFADRVWDAVADNTGVEPGSDPTKWELGAAPAKDLTGSTLLMMARAPADSNYAPLSVTSAEGGDIEITDAAAGTFTLKLPLVQLSKMRPGKYSHSLIEVRADGERDLLWHGDLVHVAGPTR